MASSHREARSEGPESPAIVAQTTMATTARTDRQRSGEPTGAVGWRWSCCAWASS